jgi:hypothetical protein
MGKIKVGIKRVNEELKLVEIEDNLQSYQKIVGGYIEVVYMDAGYIMICNEEGKFENLPVNFVLEHDYIVGDVFFAKQDREDFGTLTEFDIGYLKQYVKEVSK